MGLQSSPVSILTLYCMLPRALTTVALLSGSEDLLTTRELASAPSLSEIPVNLPYIGFYLGHFVTRSTRLSQFIMSSC